MSVHVTSWAWKQPVDDPGAKLVLLKLADNANDDGVAWPSQKRLARECGMSPRTVQRKLVMLIEAGLVEVVDDGKKAGRPHRYRVKHQEGGYDTPDVPGTPLLAYRTVNEPSTTTNGSKNEPLVRAEDIPEFWETCEQFVQKAPAARSARAAYAKIVRELLEAGWKSEDVKARAAAYKRHPTLGKTMLTLAALAKWGETLSVQKPKPVERPPEPEGEWVPPPKWPFSQEILKDMPA